MKKSMVNSSMILYYSTDTIHLHAATSMDWCMRACRATHRLLGLPKWVDSICCFWYPAD